MAESKAKVASPKSAQYISFRSQEKGVLHFTIDNLNISIANALRRTILADIPTLVFNCFPHARNDAVVHVNTSRMNNEMLKQRLSCIPIHIKDHNLPYNELTVEINMKNATESTIDITTKNFRIKNDTSGKYLEDNAVRKIFPPCPETDDYILFARLRPRISTIVPGEEISISAKMSLHTAGESGMFNVASTCAYGMTPDKIRQDEAWQKQLASMSTEDKASADVISLLQQNWYNHEGKRYFRDNSFEFSVESVGVFSNEDLVIKACDIIIEKLTKVLTLAQTAELPIEKSLNTIKNAVDIRLDGLSYSIGKIIEFMLHKLFYRGESQKLLSYVGFYKSHPHDKDSIIRLAFIDSLSEETKTTEESAAFSIIAQACTEALVILKEMAEDFK